MKTMIDSIVGGFLPAMQRIQSSSESDEQKEKRAEAWLEVKLRDLAKDIFQNILKDPAIADDTSRVGSEVDLGWEKRGPEIRQCLTRMARDYGVEIQSETSSTNSS